MSGVDKIAAERATHEARGYTAAVDDQWNFAELPKAAICYTSPFVAAMYGLWPWPNKAPLPVGNVERRIEQLAKAGALIAAEIDRLERFAARQRARVEMSAADTSEAIAEAEKARWPDEQEEEPQEYILTEPGQEPSGDEALLLMRPSSAAMCNYLLEDKGDKRRWLPSSKILGSPAIADASDDALEIVD